MIKFTLNNTILAVFFVLISFISNGQITDAKVVYEVKMDSDDHVVSAAEYDDGKHNDHVFQRE